MFEKLFRINHIGVPEDLDQLGLKDLEGLQQGVDIIYGHPLEVVRTHRHSDGAKGQEPVACRSN